MNRRNFLRGLLGSAVALTSAPILIEEVSRVYSFPTNIVIPKPTVYAYTTWDSSGVHKAAVIYYNKKLVENLKNNTTMDLLSQRWSPPSAGNKQVLVPYVYDPLDLSSDFED